MIKLVQYMYVERSLVSYINNLPDLSECQRLHLFMASPYGRCDKHDYYSTSYGAPSPTRMSPTKIV